MGYCISMNSSKFYVPTEYTGLVYAKTEGWPYDFELDGLGNIVRIEYLGEKLGDDLEMFQKIAPYVREGSFLEMRGEDGEQWRWIFRGGKCEEVRAKVSWEEE